MMTDTKQRFTAIKKYIKDVNEILKFTDSEFSFDTVITFDPVSEMDCYAIGLTTSSDLPNLNLHKRVPHWAPPTVLFATGRISGPEIYSAMDVPALLAEHAGRLFRGASEVWNYHWETYNIYLEALGNGNA